MIFSLGRNASLVNGPFIVISVLVDSSSGRRIGVLSISHTNYLCLKAYTRIKGEHRIVTGTSDPDSRGVIRLWVLDDEDSQITWDKFKEFLKRTLVGITFVLGCAVSSRSIQRHSPAYYLP